MSGRKSYVSWGEGMAYDSVNGLNFVGLESVQYNFGMELIEIPDADSMVNDFTNSKAPVTGHVVLNKLNADLFAMLTGGSAVAGGKTRTRNEAQTAVGGTFSLAATPDEYSAVIRKVGGPIMKLVASGPTGEEYTIADKLITVTGGLTASFVCDYIITTTENQVTVGVDYNDMPENFGIVSTHRAVDKDIVSEVRGDIFVIAPKVRRSSQFQFGGPPGAPTKIEFDFTIEKTPGQALYQIVFPSA